MSRSARASRLEKLGVERLYELNFNAALAGLAPEEFAERVISKGLGLRHVVVGADFCFGKGRAGTAADLQRFGGEFGFDVTIAPLLAESRSTISSTAIRLALSEGRPRDAAAMLGHWHRIEGPVIGGEQRGRQLGYPTANMSIAGLHPPAFGVYAVLVDVLDGPHSGHYRGVASLGVRPMFGENKPNLETFLFDFSGDIYGANLSVALVEHLRGEEKFADLTALVAQMDADSARARAALPVAERAAQPAEQPRWPAREAHGAAPRAHPRRAAARMRGPRGRSGDGRATAGAHRPAAPADAEPLKLRAPMHSGLRV